MPKLSDIPVYSDWEWEVLLDLATGTLISTLFRFASDVEAGPCVGDVFPEWAIPILVDALARQFDGDVELVPITAPQWYAQQDHDPNFNARVIRNIRFADRNGDIDGGIFLATGMTGRWTTLSSEDGRETRRVVVIEAEIADNRLETYVLPEEEMPYIALAIATWAIQMVRPG